MLAITFRPTHPNYGPDIVQPWRDDAPSRARRNQYADRGWERKQTREARQVAGQRDGRQFDDRRPVLGYKPPRNQGKGHARRAAAAERHMMRLGLSVSAERVRQDYLNSSDERDRSYAEAPCPARRALAVQYAGKSGNAYRR